MRTCDLLIAAVLTVSGCGSKSPGGFSKFPSDLHPAASDETRQLVETNRSQIAILGFTCHRLGQLLSGPPGDTGIVTSGEPVPGGFRLDCSRTGGDGIEMYRVLFRPVPAGPGANDQMSIDCYIRKLATPHCTELVADLLKPERPAPAESAPASD
jgi:hypothetical protein